MHAERNLLLAHLAYLICTEGEKLAGGTGETKCINSFFFFLLANSSMQLYFTEKISSIEIYAQNESYRVGI